VLYVQQIIMKASFPRSTQQVLVGSYVNI